MFKKIDINEARAKVAEAISDYEVTVDLAEKIAAILGPYVGHTFNNSVIKKTKEVAERNGLRMYLSEHYGTTDLDVMYSDWNLNKHRISKMVRRQPEPIPRLTEEWLDEFRERRRRSSRLLALIKEREAMLEESVADWNDKIEELEGVRDRITEIEGDDLGRDLYPYGAIFNLSTR